MCRGRGSASLVTSCWLLSVSCPKIDLSVCLFSPLWTSIPPLWISVPSPCRSLPLFLSLLLHPPPPPFSLPSHSGSLSFAVSPCVSHFSRVGLFATPWTVAHEAPLSMGFSRQEYGSGLPFPSPGDLPDTGIEAESPALQADSLLSAPGIATPTPSLPHSALGLSDSRILWVCHSDSLWAFASLSQPISQCSLCLPLSVLLPPPTPLPVFPAEQIGFDGGGPLWPGSLPGFGPESDC